MQEVLLGEVELAQPPPVSGREGTGEETLWRNVKKSLKIRVVQHALRST